MLLFQLVLKSRHNTKESVLFLYCGFSLFLRDLFFDAYLEVATGVVMSVWSWQKLFPEHQYGDLVYKLKKIVGSNNFSA